eukprot:3933647-Rhodomonas_salina.1
MQGMLCRGIRAAIEVCLGADSHRTRGAYQKLGELQGAVAILVKGDHQLLDFGFQLADDADVREVLREHVEADRGCTPAGLDKHHLGALDHNVLVAVAMESGTDERSDLGRECLSQN